MHDTLLNTIQVDMPGIELYCDTESNEYMVDLQGWGELARFASFTELVAYIAGMNALRELLYNRLRSLDDKEAESVIRYLEHPDN